MSMPTLFGILGQDCGAANPKQQWVLNMQSWTLAHLICYT